VITRVETRVDAGGSAIERFAVTGEDCRGAVFPLWRLPSARQLGCVVATGSKG
jgi:hypothetical protein